MPPEMAATTAAMNVPEASAAKTTRPGVSAADAEAIVRAAALATSSAATATR
ncbi:hypothetical protein GCM10022202_15350 [Microbacterium marinilacus]|uniref:Uncharacterized protein n=1 Tax=Microbacterium marinilacus TaxID=415209 RepID=A0ABP7BDF3_9MICO